jgi:hypothetical protein
MIGSNINITNKGKISVYEDILSLFKKEILVGIPEEQSERKSDEMNNATLLAIHSKGSPLRGIPARPIIEPALEASGNKEKISADLKLISEAMINRDKALAERLMNLTGQDAVNIVLDWFTDPRNNWPPDKEATVKAKIKKAYKDKKKVKQTIKKYLAGEEGINQTLVDTAQMKKAITYVIRDKK